MLTKHKKSEQQEISTASMPDIIFMLLIFFMVTTVMREFRGLPVELPKAKNANKIEGKRNVAYTFVDMQERISIDDKLVTPADLTLVANFKRVQNPRVVISLKVDKRVKYGLVDQVQKALQDADARRIVYATLTKE